MTELADRLSRHADLHEHQPWADDEQMQFARDLREAVGLIAELARLRAQVPVGWIGPSGFTHNTATNRMWMRESPKLAAKLSPVYAAPPAQPAEPRNTCPDCNSPTILPCAYCGCKNYPKDAQPADPIEARSRYETAYAGHQLPHTQTTTSEPVQPQGWVSMPVCLTPEMREVLLMADRFTVGEVYIMLLAAAPKGTP